MMYDAGPRPEPWMMLAVMAATDELCHELGHGKVNSVCRNLPSILHTIYNTVHKHSGEYHYTNFKKHFTSNDNNSTTSILFEHN